MPRISGGTDLYEKILSQLRGTTQLSNEDLKLILEKPNIHWKDEQLEELYIAAIKNNFASVFIIPLNKLVIPGQNKFKDEITVAILQKDFGDGMSFIEQLLKEGGGINSLGYKTISLIVQHNGLALEDLDTTIFREEQRKELYGKAIKSNPDAIRFIPENEHINIYLQELKKDWRVLKLLYERILKQNNETLNKAINEAIKECKNTIKKDWKEIKYIPEILLDHDAELIQIVDDACRQGIQREWWQLNIIPEKIKNNDIYLLAVRADAEALQYVPVQRRTFAVCLEAVLKDTASMRWIKNPKHRPALTKEEYLALCRSAIANNKEAIHWVYGSEINEINISDIPEKKEVVLNSNAARTKYSKNNIGLNLHNNLTEIENKKNAFCKTVVIALDIHETDPDYNSWKNLSARQKIDKLIERIDHTCYELKNNNSNARWVIGFREYAITEQNIRHVDNDIRKYFKEQMAKITEKYRDNELTIIGGTLSTKKPYNLDNTNDKERIIKIVKSYRQPSHFEVIEKEENNFISVAGGMADHEISAAKKLRFNVKEGHIVRNTMYCFTDGKLLGTPHDKLTPWFELSDNKFGLFQTQNKKGNFGYYELGNISFGVDICREHTVSVFKNMCLAKKIKIPDLHFLISDSNELHRESIYGEYAIHIDSQNATRLVCCINDKSKLHIPIDSICLYTVNMSSNEFEIKGPFYAEENVKELELTIPEESISRKEM